VKKTSGAICYKMSGLVVDLKRCTTQIMHEPTKVPVMYKLAHYLQIYSIGMDLTVEEGCVITTHCVDYDVWLKIRSS
jgi:hypothetical protein